MRSRRRPRRARPRARRRRARHRRRGPACPGARVRRRCGLPPLPAMHQRISPSVRYHAQPEIQSPCSHSTPAVVVGTAPCERRRPCGIRPRCSALRPRAPCRRGRSRKLVRNAVHGTCMCAMRFTAPSSSGNTSLRSAAAYQRVDESRESFAAPRPRGRATRSDRCGCRRAPSVSVAKSWLPSICSRSAAVSWLTWLVTAFQPSWYIARLPQHS